jgi:hypothetical protein
MATALPAPSLAYPYCSGNGKLRTCYYCASIPPSKSSLKCFRVRLSKKKQRKLKLRLPFLRLRKLQRSMALRLVSGRYPFLLFFVSVCFSSLWASKTLTFILILLFLMGLFGFLFSFFICNHSFSLFFFIRFLLVLVRGWNLGYFWSSWLEFENHLKIPDPPNQPNKKKKKKKISPTRTA